MTAVKGTLSQLLVDEFDFSGDTAAITVTINMAEEDSTTLGATASVYEPILPSMKIEHNGYIGGDNDIEQELYDLLGGSSYVAALFGTDAVGCPAYVHSTFGAQMQLQFPAKGLITLNGAWAMGSGGYRGYRIYSGTISGTGLSAAIDLGSAGSAGGDGFLFIQTITGSASSATIKIQSASTEGGSYADEGTFTFSAVGVQVLAMTGTVNRWLKLSTTSMGGATSFAVTAIGCVDGVTQ
jgi:hypothetical protein